MKLSQAREYLPFVQAAAEGKTIQWKSACGGEWIDVGKDESEPYSIFGSLPKNLRIKPEPKLRPWKPGEVPVEAWFSADFGVRMNRLVHISANGELRCGFFDSPDCCEHSYLRGDLEYAFKYWKHSTDGGKTWKICGVEEE